MKKWIFIGIGVAALFHFGWLGLREYYYHEKGVPKSHFVGYLIYGDKYIQAKGPQPGSVTQKKEESIKIAKQQELQKLKTPESVKETYLEAMKIAKTELDKYNATVAYYKDMIALEKDPIKIKEWEQKFVELQAKEYARANADLQYKSAMAAYEDIQNKIANYKKNNVRPPSKLLKLAQEKPDREAIYKSLYLKQKALLEGKL